MTPRDFHAHDFWRSLTNKTSYEPSRARATSLCNPCFRYIHRIMAHTCFGRSDSDGVIRQSDLLFLWVMMHEARLDMGSHLARQFARVGRAASCNIVIGCLITPLAPAFNYNLFSLTEAIGST